MSAKPLNIAVVGSGIGGLGAAWGLSRTHHVTLFEQNAELGGHAHTVSMRRGREELPVDVGFIVYNRRTYPNFTQLLKWLGVESNGTSMSLSVSRRDGFSWSSWNPLGTRSVLSRRFARMLKAMARFKTLARQDMGSSDIVDMSLDTWLEARGFPTSFRDDYLAPMAGAIWSAPVAQIGQFPADALLRFFINHGLTDLKRPQWYTVKGGSKRYVSAIARGLKHLHLESGVKAVERTRDGVRIRTEKEPEGRLFDHVVLAGHSDQCLSILSDPTPKERALLSQISYSENDVVLHSDPRLMPAKRGAWASWNAVEAAGPFGGHVSYWMNKLQHLPKRCPTFVTLNPAWQPRDEHVYGRWSFAHPQFDTSAIAAQARLHEIQGEGGLWYAGAWHGYGFHEDGLASGLWVAQRLHADLAFEPDFSRLPYAEQSPQKRGQIMEGSLEVA